MRTCHSMAITRQSQGCFSSPSSNHKALRRLTLREHQLHASCRWPRPQCVWSTRQRLPSWHKRYSLRRQVKGPRTWCRPITRSILVLVLEGGRTYISGDAANDDLLLPGCFDSVTELLIIPSINLSVTLDEWCVGMHGNNFLRQRSIGSCCSVSIQDVEIM